MLAFLASITSLTFLVLILGGQGLLLSLGETDLDFALLNSFIYFLLSIIGSIWVFGCLTVLSFILQFALLGGEVDEILAQVDLLAEWILLEFGELSQFPFALSLLLLLFALLLLPFDFFFACFLFLEVFLALLITLTPLRRILGLSLVALHDTDLGLRNPLNVLKQGLLDLIVTHLSIELLLLVIHLLPHISDLILDLVHFYIDVGQFMLDVRLGALELSLLLLDLANLLLDLIDDLVSWRQVIIDSLLLLSLVANGGLDLVN